VVASISPAPQKADIFSLEYYANPPRVRVKRKPLVKHALTVVDQAAIRRKKRDYELQCKERKKLLDYQAFLRKYAVNFERGDYPKPTMEEWLAQRSDTWAVYHHYKPTIMRTKGVKGGYCVDHGSFDQFKCFPCLEVERRRNERLRLLEVYSPAEIEMLKEERRIKWLYRDLKRNAQKPEFSPEPWRSKKSRMCDIDNDSDGSGEF